MISNIYDGGLQNEKLKYQLEYLGRRPGYLRLVYRLWGGMRSFGRKINIIKERKGLLQNSKYNLLVREYALYFADILLKVCANGSKKENGAVYSRDLKQNSRNKNHILGTSLVN